MNQNKKFLMLSAAIAIIISILAPFLASSNPDGLEKNLMVFVGKGSMEKAENIIEEKNIVDYKAPFPDYSIEGMNKAGEVLAMLIGTIIMLVLGIGVSKLLKKKE